MTATNSFLPFGTGTGANVLDDPTYLTLTARQTGYQAGVASSLQLNKTWRQSSVIAALIGQFITDYAGVNATDSTAISTLETNLVSAIVAVNRAFPEAGLYQSKSLTTTTYAIGQSDTGTMFTSQTATGDQNYTLPPKSQTPQGFAVAFIRKGGHNITVNTTAGDTTTIITPYAGTLTSIGLTVEGSFVWLFFDGGNWINISYSDTFRWQSTYLGNVLGGGLGGAGFQSFPSGLIMQWGRSSVGPSGSLAMTFPAAFPANPLMGFATAEDGGASTTYRVSTANMTTTGMNLINTSSGTVNINWLALGH